MMFESDFAGNLHSWNAGGINSLFSVKIKKRGGGPQGLCIILNISNLCKTLIEV